MISMLILNGPNLNMLGQRQPELYGRATLADIEALCQNHADQHKITVDFKQSNHEGELVDLIQRARGCHDAIIINAGAYTHTSVAIMDAITSAECPAIELHLSNIHARETFRHHSYLARVCIGQICGFGAHGYILAMDAMLDHLMQQAV